MRFWPKKQVEQKAATLAEPDNLLLSIFGALPGETGIAVSPTSAMRCTPVRAAVQAIAEPIGQLPLHCYRKNGEGRERESKHPVAKVLADPNEWTSAQDFREQLQRDALLHGNGYAFIGRAGGKPIEMTRIRPEVLSVQVDDKTGEPIYRLAGKAGGGSILDRRDVFHIKAPSLNGVTGVSPVNDCKEAIGVCLVIEKHVARLFGKSAKPAGVIEIPGNVGETVITRLKEGWQAAHAGVANAAGTAVLHSGAKFTAMQLSSVDAQTLEIWQHAITEIARIYRVPPHMIFEMGRATCGNAGEMGATFLNFTLMRWIKAWQGEIRLKLFEPDERDELYAEFQTNDFLKADLSARATAYSQLVTARIMNPNECRARENLPPYAGGDQFLNPNVSPTAKPGSEDA